MQSLTKFKTGRLAATSPRRVREISSGSAVFVRLTGRTPAFFRRRVGQLLSAWRKPIAWSMCGIAVWLIGFSASGQPARDGARALAENATLAAGLRVGEIVIEGESGIPDADIIEALAPLNDVSLPFFNAADARERIMAIPRIQAASVMKLYPNTLHLKIVERAAFGLWQRGGHVSVIDRDGRVVRQVPDGSQVRLPLYVGEGANVSARALRDALAQVPALRARVSAAVRIADRRWNLKLDNGVDVRLPENDAPRALAALSTMMRQTGFFDQPIKAIDLRLADRVTLTLTKEGAVARRALIERRSGAVKERHT